MSTNARTPRPTAARPTRAVTSFNPTPTTYKTLTRSEKGAEVYSSVRNGATSTIYRRPQHGQSQTLSKRGTIILAVVLGIAALLGLLIFGWHLHRRRRVRVQTGNVDAEAREEVEAASPEVKGMEEGNGYTVGYAESAVALGGESQGVAGVKAETDEKGGK